MSGPPRLARRLIERWVASHLAESVLGDLEELFAVEALRSRRAARLAYWRRAASAVWHLRGRRPVAPVPRGDSPMRSIWKDVVHGLRLFVQQPGYAWAAVITLALAIGANTLIFTFANVLVIKPLPFRDTATLGWILVSGPNAAQDRAGVSLPEFAAYRDEVTAFTQLAAWRREQATLRVDDEAERVLAQVVIGDLCGVWGVAVDAGRPLAAGDERPAAPRVAMISHRFWLRRFGGAAGVVGRDVLLDGEPHTIVGVVSPEIELGNMAEIDVWRPWTGDPALASRSERRWRPVGRLRAGASLADAHAQVTAIATRLGREHPETSGEWTARAGTTLEAMTGGNTGMVLALLALVVGLLLVLACANIMNLLIARLLGRRQELAVRTALGATRGRVVRQILAESLVLGVAGGLLGLAIAAAGLRAVHAVATEPFFDQLAIDWRVIVFAFALSLIAPLVFAVAPVLRVLGHDVRAALLDATPRSVGGTGRSRAVLVLVQVSLAVMLLVVASLVVQSMRAFIAVDPGYDTARLLVADIEVPAWKLADDGEALRLRRRLIERARAIPGVEAAATTTALPALEFPARTMIEVGGVDATTDRDRPSAGLVVTSADYFATLGLPLVAGRAFTAADAAGTGAVAVARRYWGDPASAVGGVVRVASPGGGAPLAATVVGVSADPANPLAVQAPEPMVMLLDEHRPTRSASLVVRSTAPAALAPVLRSALREVDADLAYRLRTVEEGFADENSSNQLLIGMFAGFALVALLLATAGLYGVISYAVSQRTPEIAVRMALGASQGEIARDVVGHSLRLALLGTGAGLAGAYGLAQAITSVLYGVTAGDPPTYIGAAAVAIVSAVAAAWLPMRRAAHVDPIQSLRQA
jgi:putative ABC transport system permease protein